MFNLVFRSSGLEAGLILFLSLLTIIFILITQGRPRVFFNLASVLCKILAAVLITFLLLQPEMKKVTQVEKEAELLLLIDESPSMETRDVSHEGNTLMRKEAVEAFLQSAEWEKFQNETEFKVVKKSFGQGEEETNLSSALELGERASSILLLSDGAWNTGDSPSLVSQKLRKEKISIFSLSTGTEESLPDVLIQEMNAPLTVETAEDFLVSALVKSTFKTAMTVTVTLKLGEDVVEEKEVELSPSVTEEVLFKTQILEEAERDYTLTVSHRDEEVTAENNTRDFRVSAREQQLEVLLIDTLPRWEYRFIRNAMMRDPKVKVSCLLLHPEIPPGAGPSYIPAFPEDLSAYDVVLLGDIGIGENQLSEEDALSIVQAVRENATGLMLIPGEKMHQKTLYENEDFTTLYPVEIGDFTSDKTEFSSGLKLSEEGEGSLLLSLSSDEEKNGKIWENLPGFSWYQPVIAAKSGAQTLAYHSTSRNEQGRVPVIVTGKSGRGKILWMGMDSSWKWRRGVEDLYHYRFWRQVAQWMAYQRNLTQGEQVKIFLNTDTPMEGSKVPLTLQAMTKEGKPARPEDVRLILTPTGEKGTLIPLIPTSNWGEFKAGVPFQTSGGNTLSVEVNDERVGEREIQVQAKKKETLGESADLNALQEISRLTKGASVPFSSYQDLIPQLIHASRIPPEVEFLALNKSWVWYALIILLLSLAWIFRRVATGE